MDYIKRITAVAISGAALAFSVPLFVSAPASASAVPYPFTLSDSIYCQTLHAWDQSGIPGTRATRRVAADALRAEGRFKRTGTALITAIVAGGSFRTEAVAAFGECHLRIVKAAK